MAKCNKVISVKENIGHFNGNSQLLHAGMEYMPDDCDYTVILEADTWMYGDQLIRKYIKRLTDENAVWASAQFFRYVSNLATDIAIIKTSFIKQNRDIFTFVSTPEYYVANYLTGKNYNFIYITENMPISLPRYVRRFPFAPTGRFFTFENSKMVTHHIESLKGGMDEKKRDFNMVSKTDYFKNHYPNNGSLKILVLRTVKLISYLLPYKGWFFKTKHSYQEV
ncbi:hypothetical protein RG47T_2398 [Mucilaginibacter polytrichastri]|uniref:Glycosyltransferase 2-like domain-containing protein n=2 Tax=Mucilaginibacter polytrichastri TaxID=1302689 RepID=A0A1Q5ZYU6_9SPHI|nr:hypothetical protein RG47T_2398 [Mucilaginibacter polytrichastri]